MAKGKVFFNQMLLGKLKGVNKGTIMPKIKNSAETIVIDYICDHCQKGLMLKFGKVNVLIDPIRINHKCNNCGFENFFLEEYPKIEYNYTIDKPWNLV